MAPKRFATPARTVEIFVDGERVIARADEPVAMAIAASGRVTLGRSTKYHRPRGAVCFSGSCDGCLMRVDGVPSRMTCRVPARAGMQVETQNVVGSARVDLLAATDWFFRDGMNHHEMFTWNEQLNKVMQKVARRIAGIGTLPDTARAPIAGREIRPDVLVVGAGPAGLRASAVLAEAGFSVCLVDEEPALGGTAQFFPAPVEIEDERVRAAGVDVRSSSSVVGIYPAHEDIFGVREGESFDGRPVALILSDEGLVRALPERIVLATGRRSGSVAIEGADLPGVVSFDGASRMFAAGIAVGERVVLVGRANGIDELGERLREVGTRVHGPIARSSLVRLEGRPTLERCTYRDGEEVRELECDAAVIVGPTSTSYELAMQAGVGVRFADGRFELEASARDGSTARRGVRVIGAAAGQTGIGEALEHAENAARAILEEPADG